MMGFFGALELLYYYMPLRKGFVLVVSWKGCLTISIHPS